MVGAFGMLPWILAWVGLFLIARDLSTRGLMANRWPLHWALACVMWGTLLTLIVEMASLLHWVNGPVLLAAWLSVDAVLVLVLLRRWNFVVQSCGQGMCELRAMWGNCPRDAAALLVMMATLVAVLFAIALLTPTTNWDSLTYHLPRMLHWLQQGTVEHFPTNNFRQSQFAPWASYALMHLFAFSGGDQYLNLMQWGAMLSTLIVMSFVALTLARRTGFSVDLHCADSGPRAWRLMAFACLIVATIPIGVVESLTTQNDYVVTFWVCCAVAFALALMNEPRNVLYAAGTGGALGLATLTKSTAFVYAAPFVLALTVWWLTRLEGARARLRVASAICSMFLLLNSGHMLRNQLATGSPFGSPEIFKLERNKRLTMRNACSNIIRNLALNSNSGIRPVTQALNRSLEWLHGLTGADLNEAATTYHGCRFFFREKFIVLDSYTSNTWHVFLFVVAGIAAAVRPRSYPTLLLYGALAAAGFLLFCFYLKWQWWHSRLHLGFLVLAAPLAGILLTRNLSRSAILILGALLTLFAVFSLMKNQSRPVLSAEFIKLPREDKYMAIDGPHLSRSLGVVADAVVASESEKVGLNLPFDAAEYPLWMMLRKRGFAGRINHVTAEPLNYDVMICCDESPWKVAPSQYPYSRTAGYYTVRWKEQPSFPVEPAKRE